MQREGDIYRRRGQKVLISLADHDLVESVLLPHHCSRHGARSGSAFVGTMAKPTDWCFSFSPGYGGSRSQLKAMHGLERPRTFRPLDLPSEGALREAFLADARMMARRAQKSPTRFRSPAEFAEMRANHPYLQRWIPGTHTLLAQSTLEKYRDGFWALRCPSELETRLYGAVDDSRLWQELGHLAVPTILIGSDPKGPSAAPLSRKCSEIHHRSGLPHAMIPQSSTSCSWKIRLRARVL